MLKQSVGTRDYSVFCMHSLEVDVHVIKLSVFREGARGTISLRACTIPTPNRDDHVKVFAGVRFEVCYQQFKSQLLQKEEFICQRKQI